MFGDGFVVITHRDYGIGMEGPFEFEQAVLDDQDMPH